MNTDHIANWAIKSGINIRTGEYGFICSKTISILHEFAKHVVAYEREACAKKADKWSKRDDDVGAFIGKAIRARKSK